MVHLRFIQMPFPDVPCLIPFFLQHITDADFLILQTDGSTCLAVGENTGCKRVFSGQKTGTGR
ncbi:hypothetical protein SDC9_150171 [bioreactor metagenome]|uniref:Uncharacterized protein n=1 Tax=bioreactor metagenome TaxID=1076179 RepID=A0A645ENL4_9ZZZZ